MTHRKNRLDRRLLVRVRREGDQAGGQVLLQVFEDGLWPLHPAQVLQVERPQVGHFVEGHQAGVGHDGTPVDLGKIIRVRACRLNGFGDVRYLQGLELQLVDVAEDGDRPARDVPEEEDFKI